MLWAQSNRFSTHISNYKLLFKELSKAKDKYPNFKYIDILNSQIKSFQLKFTERLENRLSSKTIKVLLSNKAYLLLSDQTILLHFRWRFARYVHILVKNWNLLFYCSNIAKSENAMLWRMLSRLKTCILYCCIWTVTLAKSIVPRKTWRKLWHYNISKLFLTKMQIKFSIFFHRGSLNVIGDKFRFISI
jgi:hypothetical protein